MSGNGCSICFESFSHPIACVPCGHVFCQSCINQWNQSPYERGCPHCRVPILGVQKIIWDSNNIYLDCKKSAETILGDAVQERIVWVKERIDGFTQYIRGETRLLCRRIWDLAHADGLTQLPGQLKTLWNGLGYELQLLVSFLLILVLSLLIQDVKNDVGIIQGCLLPVGALLVDIVRHVLGFLLFVISRPIICLGTCAFEVLLTVWDVAFVLMSTLFVVCKDLVLIPSVVVRAVGNGFVIVLHFMTEIVMTIVRVLFIVALIFVLLLLARPQPQMGDYVSQIARRLVDIWLDFRRRQHVS